MKNSELIAYRAGTLTSLERQRRFVLQNLARPMPCPNCGTMNNYFEASGIDVDALDLATSSANAPCKCRSCGRGLVYTVPFMGGVRWTLVPVSPPVKITQGAGKTFEARHGGPYCANCGSKAIDHVNGGCPS